MGTVSPIFTTTHWLFWTGKRLALRTDDFDVSTEQTQGQCLTLIVAGFDGV